MPNLLSTWTRRSFSPGVSGGIVSFVEYLNKNKNPLHNKVLYCEKEADDMEVEIGVPYNDKPSCEITSNSCCKKRTAQHKSRWRPTFPIF
ncbi:MAG: hypothetical protein HY787_20470 [Deltaproteobacteria bacterium]|nr:hypothetical protein [Deltaproteobacteria bacterium]